MAETVRNAGIGLTQGSAGAKRDSLLVHTLESIAEAVSVTDLDDRFIYVNQAFLAIYGYTREELLGQHVSLVWSPKNPSGLQREILDHTRAGGWKGELLNRTKDGREVLIALSTSRFRDEAGQIHALVGIAQDITDRRQAEDALASRTRQLEAVRAITADITRELDLAKLLDLIISRAVHLVGAVSGQVFLWDESTQVLVPRAWCGLGDWLGDFRLKLGESISGVVAERREGMIVNDYQTSPFAHPTVLQRSKISAVLSEPLLYRDRLVGVISLDDQGTGRPFTEKDREILGLFAYQAAIAIENARLHGGAIRRGEELGALLRATRSVMAGLDLRETLDRILEEASHMARTPHVKVLLLDREAQVLRLAALAGRPVALLEGFRLPLGIGHSGIVASTAQALFVPDCPNDSRNLYADQDRELGLVTYLGLPILMRGEVLGVLTFNTEESRRYSPEEIAYLTSFADMAAIAIENARLHEAVRQQAADLEARIRTRTAELEEALRVKALFLANMSHELRTPLNFVLGFSEILREGSAGPLNPKQASYVERVHAGGKRLLELVKDLLEMAETHTGPTSFQLDRLVVKEILEEVLAPLAVIAQAKSVALEVDLHPGLPALVADRRKFSQVLHHLVSNAIRFTPTGGRVAVSARRSSGPKGEEATLTVQDTGIGIRPEDRERIFRPFEQVDGSDTRKYGGAGLGLALVRRLVELHGGSVWAESDGEGRGARFIVRLPLLPSPPPPRILVVDDEAPVREAISAALAAAGHTVDGACSGLEALERLAASPPDLLVLDIGLPDQDGREVLRQVRADARNRDLPILVLTGLNSIQPHQVLTLGADEFLTKPLSHQVLSTTVARLLRQPFRETPLEGPSVGVDAQEHTGRRA